MIWRRPIAERSCPNMFKMNILYFLLSLVSKIVIFTSILHITLIEMQYANYNSLSFWITPQRGLGANWKFSPHSISQLRPWEEDQNNSWHLRILFECISVSDRRRTFMCAGESYRTRIKWLDAHQQLSSQVYIWHLRSECDLSRTYSKRAHVSCMINCTSL